MTAYLRPTAAIAADVVLIGDPGLAMTVAQAVLEKPLMSNHQHGLWGYSGRTASGLELTVQATGIGAPSAAVVLGELAGHGARRVVCVGRGSALGADLEPGAAAVVVGALGDDGVSRALGAQRPSPDAELTRGLLAASRAPETIVASFDLPAASCEDARRAAWRAGGAVAADLETAALLAVGRLLGVAIGAGLVVEADGDAERVLAELEAGALGLGRAAVEALGRRAEIGPGAARD